MLKQEFFDLARVDVLAAAGAKAGQCTSECCDKLVRSASFQPTRVILLCGERSRKTLPGVVCRKRACQLGRVISSRFYALLIRSRDDDQSESPERKSHETTRQTQIARQT